VILPDDPPTNGIPEETGSVNPVGVCSSLRSSWRCGRFGAASS